MNRRALMIVITGLIAAVAAAAVVFYLLTLPTGDTGGVVAQPTPLPRTEVVVASTDIPAATVITASMVATRTYAISDAPEDAIRTISEVVGLGSSTPIFSGQVLLKRQVGPIDLINVGGIGKSSRLVKPGKVLVAFPSTDMLNATGAVTLGDHVDILLTIPISGTTRIDSGVSTGTQLDPGARALVTQATLQNAVVVSIGNWTPPGQNGNAENQQPQSLKIITFMVDPQEALILKYVKDSGGTIDLAIRSDKDDGIFQTDPVTIDYLVDLYDLLGLKAPAPTP